MYPSPLNVSVCFFEIPFHISFLWHLYKSQAPTDLLNVKKFFLMLAVISILGSTTLVLEFSKKEFRAKNSEFRAKSTRGKSLRQTKWASWAAWTQETRFRSTTRALRERRRKKAKIQRKEDLPSCAWRGKVQECSGDGAYAGSFVSRGFICFLKSGILGKVSGEDLNRIFINFPGLIHQNEHIVSGSWSLYWLVGSR